MTQNNSSVTQYLLNKYGNSQGQGGYNPQTGTSYIPANVQQAQQSQVAQYLVNKYAGDRKTWTQRQQETRAWEEEKKRQEEQRRLQEARERQKQSQPIAQNRLGQSMSQNLMNTPYAKLQNQAVGYNPTTQRNQPVATSKTGQPLTSQQLQAQNNSPYLQQANNIAQDYTNQTIRNRAYQTLVQRADTQFADKVLQNPNSSEEKKKLAQRIKNLEADISMGKKPGIQIEGQMILSNLKDMAAEMQRYIDPSSQSQQAKFARYSSKDKELSSLQAEYDALKQKQQMVNPNSGFVDFVGGLLNNAEFAMEFAASKAGGIPTQLLYIGASAADDINKRNLNLVEYNPKTNHYEVNQNLVKQANERLNDPKELVKDLGISTINQALQYITEEKLGDMVDTITSGLSKTALKIPTVQKAVNGLSKTWLGGFAKNVAQNPAYRQFVSFMQFAGRDGLLGEQMEEEVQFPIEKLADRLINEEEAKLELMSGKERMMSLLTLGVMMGAPMALSGVATGLYRKSSIDDTEKALKEVGFTDKQAKTLAPGIVDRAMQIKQELENPTQQVQEQQPAQEQQPVQEQETQISESVADLSPESEDVVSITDNNGQVLQIQRNQELNPQAQNVEQDFINQLQNLEDKVVEYEQRFGNEINTDNARYLLDKYADKAFRQEHTYETQRPASAFSTYLYERKLNELKNSGKEGVVVFTAGGTGAGKSTALTNIGADLNNADLVFDSNLSNIEAALKKINQALEAGQKVEIDYIHSDVIKAWERALARAEEEGRTLPISEHIRQHNGALQTIQQLEKEFANNEDVTFRIIDNTGENGTQKVIGLDKLPSQLYNIADLERRLEQITKELYDKGSISKSNYQSSVRKTQAQRSARRYDSEFNDSKSQKSSSRSSKQKESQSVNSDNKSPQSVQNEDNVLPSQKDKETPQTPQNEPVKQETKPQTKEDRAVAERLKSLDKNANEVYNRVLQSLQEGNKKVTKAAKMNAALTAGYAQKWAERMNQIKGGENYTALDFLDRLNIEANAKEAAKVDAQNQVFNQEVKKQVEDIKKEFEGTDKWLKAPNGKDTNLTEDQWLAVRTDAFKKWFGDWENDPENASKVLDENGEPKVVYHGSINTFNAFDKSKASVESDMGAGFYFTDNMADVEDNYYDGGPDFDNKVARLAENLQSEDENLSDEEAKQKAEKELRGESHLFDCFLSIKHPCYVGNNETSLTPDLADIDRNDYDNEEDYQNDALNYLSDNIDYELGDILDYSNIEKVKGLVFEKINDGLTLQALKDRLADEYLEDFDGNPVASEVARRIASALGFDGIVDSSVSKKFEKMNIYEDTTHYIAFEPTQIKSVDNRGTFSSEDANIYNQAAANQLKGQVIINQARRTIKLFESADQSTFAHELGHIALTDLKEMASMEGASAEIKNDWKTVSSWLDIKQDQTNFTTKQQEQFARGFEAWLRTGQTQVTGLKGVFRRFKQMLTSLYKTFKELGGKPPKNVAEVMERMVATTAEAQEAAKDRKLKPEFWDNQVKRAYPGISKEAREEMVDTLISLQDGYGNGSTTTLIYDQTGNNVIERKTVTNNAPWYTEFYRNNNKKPSIADQIEIAHDMIFGEGYGNYLDEEGKKAAQNFFDKGGRLEYDEEGSAKWIPRSQVEDSVVSPKDVDDYLSAVAEQGEQAKRPEKVVKVPQRQLPVQTKDKTAKERLSKFEARVLGVGDKLDKMSQEEIDELGLQTYKQSSNKEQLEKAARMVAKDPDNVFSILSGEKPLPKDMLYGSLYIAYQEYANQEGEEGNYQAALAAASLQATRAGQEIQILSNIDKNSPVSIINRIYQTRIEALGERMGRTKNTTEARRIAKQEINKQTNEKMAEFNSEMKKNTKEDNNNLEKLLAEVIC